jgi:hypothetical protein
MVLLRPVELARHLGHLTGTCPDSPFLVHVDIAEQRIFKSEADPMRCRVCEQLEEALAKTQRPDSPELLIGLTAAGMRNHTHQRQERALKAETDLKKHKSACSKRDRESDPAC